MNTKRLSAGVIAIVAVAGAGCTRAQSEGFDRRNSDYTPASVRHFDRFPLYWTGPRFGRWQLNSITYSFGFLTFVYGTCTPSGGDEPSCSPPIQIQEEPICLHLKEVAHNPIWRHRTVRGAPVGSIDAAPVLFARNTQIKVYASGGTDEALRVLDALRSANRLAPVVAPGEPIPAATGAVLTGDRACDA